MRQDVLGILWVLIRAAHILAATAWVGGNLFYQLVLTPLFRRNSEARAAAPAVSRAFGNVVNAAAWVLILTGGYMTFNRLTNTRVGLPYVVILAIKLALVIWMILLAGALSRNRGKRRIDPERRIIVPVPTLILWLGLVIFVLSAALTTIYQNTPPPHPPTGTASARDVSRQREAGWTRQPITTPASPTTHR